MEVICWVVVGSSDCELWDSVACWRIVGFGAHDSQHGCVDFVC